MPQDVPKKPLIMIAARERGKFKIIFLLYLCTIELHHNFILSVYFSSIKNSEHLSLIFRILSIAYIGISKSKYEIT